MLDYVVLILDKTSIALCYSLICSKLDYAINNVVFKLLMHFKKDHSNIKIMLLRYFVQFNTLNISHNSFCFVEGNNASRCSWGKWSEWIQCSESCGTGCKVRSRTKTVVESVNGTCTGGDKETEKCQIRNNHCEPILGTWSPLQKIYCISYISS